MEIGDVVPDFTASLDSGEAVTLSDLVATGPVVLFFYPKAFTPGCTAEACHFRDLSAEFAEVGAKPLGVSRDDVTTQRSFAAQHGLTFPLVADRDGSIARIFGAKRMGPLPAKRQTFVVGRDQRLLGTVRSETDMQRHADEALRILRRP